MITMYELIEKKKRGGEHSAEELQWLVDGYVSGEIPDYQVSAWLMAVCFTSMTDRETADLTMSMARSGEMLRPDFGGFTADKHSTGGVGDKTSLIVAPIAATCGVFMPKMSGRGLGHTGGTIDKLESIPGFRTSLSEDEFAECVKKAGFAIAGQTQSLVPADKKLYALRNATATVDSIPLICSSIMSKKIATGTDGIVLDVKFGDGAFMKIKEDAEKLAELMVKVGKLAGRKCAAVISDMDQPLGNAVGNSLEVIEAIEALKGNSPKDLYDVSIELAHTVLRLAGKDENMAEEALSSGNALEALRKMIEAQGGDPNVIDDYSLFGKAERTLDVISPKDGIIKKISCEKAGLISLKLGAGRKSKEDSIDSTAGIIFNKKVGDKVSSGEKLGTLYTSSECSIDELGKEFENLFFIE